MALPRYIRIQNIKKGANHVAAENKDTETITEEIEAKKTKKEKANQTDKKTDSYRVAVPLLNIREKASLNAEVIGTLTEGEKMEITSRTPQGFGKLADREGYVKLEFVKKEGE